MVTTFTIPSLIFLLVIARVDNDAKQLQKALSVKSTIHLRDVSIGEALQILGQVYQVDIEVSSSVRRLQLEQHRVREFSSVDKNLSEILTRLLAPHGLCFRVIDDKIEIVHLQPS